MPLTNTLETARRIESLGFTHQQAQGFAELFEETAHATQQDLKDFIREQLGALEGRLEGKFGTLEGKLGALEGRLEGKLGALEGRMQVQFAELRTELHSSLRDQTLKMMAIFVAAISLAVAIIKLFPNVH